jgi:hypothetical protein
MLAFRLRVVALLADLLTEIRIYVLLVRIGQIKDLTKYATVASCGKQLNANG